MRSVRVRWCAVACRGSSDDRHDRIHHMSPDGQQDVRGRRGSCHGSVQMNADCRGLDGGAERERSAQLGLLASTSSFKFALVLGPFVQCGYQTPERGERQEQSGDLAKACDGVLTFEDAVCLDLQL